MNTQKAKKLRRMYAKTMRNVAYERLVEIQKMVRPRPVFIPKFIWRMLVRFVLNLK